MKKEHIKEKILFIDSFDSNKKIIEKNEVIEAIGGDGTLLKAIAKYHKSKKPFFGIAGGTENFLMNAENTIIKNHKLKKFRLLKVTVTYSEDNITDINKTFEAFNEIFISEENGWIEFNCEDKDFILGNFKGSGLIVSTPQGSTGINKNNNGVILPLNSKAWSITGDKTNRKINYVFETNKINIEVKSRGKVNLFIDGTNNKISNISKVTITKGNSVEVIFNNYKEFKRKRRI